MCQILAFSVGAITVFASLSLLSLFTVNLILPFFVTLDKNSLGGCTARPAAPQRSVCLNQCDTVKQPDDTNRTEKTTIKNKLLKVRLWNDYIISLRAVACHSFLSGQVLRLKNIYRGGIHITNTDKPRHGEPHISWLSSKYFPANFQNKNVLNEELGSTRAW